jgi:hypothetical protein
VGQHVHGVWIDTTLAALSGFLYSLTLLWGNWVEAILQGDSDRHSGALKWVIVATLVLATAVCGTRADMDWRRLAATRREGESHHG